MVMAVSAESAPGTMASAGPPGTWMTPPSAPMVTVVPSCTTCVLEPPPQPIDKATTTMLARARMGPLLEESSLAQRTARNHKRVHRQVAKLENKPRLEGNRPSPAWRALQQIRHFAGARSRAYTVALDAARR